MAWHREDANLSRRSHSAVIQHAAFSAALFVVWVLYPTPAWMPRWAHWCVLGLIIWYQVWPHTFLERANRALTDHEEREPQWGELPE